MKPGAYHTQEARRKRAPSVCTESPSASSPRGGRGGESAGLGPEASFAGDSSGGAVLKDLGQLEEARDLERKALASAEKTFEPGHPSIARSQSNLALVLKDLGQLEEARDLLRKALASAEKTFEPGHPSIATRQSNLALVLQDLGQLEEVRDLLRKAHRAYLSRFGPDHPGTQTIQRNLEGVGN